MSKILIPFSVRSTHGQGTITPITHQSHPKVLEQELDQTEFRIPGAGDQKWNDIIFVKPKIKMEVT